MKLRLLGTILSILLLVAACNEGGEITGKETAHVNFKLVDHPVNYDAVLIDLVGLEYRLEVEDDEVEEDEDENESEGEENSRVAGDDEECEDDDKGEWYVVDIEPQVYDILQLQNGAEALLAELDIEAGELKEIRVILGDNNKVVVDGDTLDLKVPSGASSGLKIKVRSEIEAGEFYDVVIDFVASKSIVRTGNGKYILKPVIKVKLVHDEDPYGSISGLISPSDLSVMVHAINANEDTASTQPEDGAYLINLLLPGSYTVVVEPLDDSGFSDVTISDVIVKEEEITELETVTFE